MNTHLEQSNRNKIVWTSAIITSLLLGLLLIQTTYSQQATRAGTQIGNDTFQIIGIGCDDWMRGEGALKRKTPSFPPFATVVPNCSTPTPTPLPVVCSLTATLTPAVFYHEAGVNDDYINFDATWNSSGYADVSLSFEYDIHGAIDDEIFFPGSTIIMPDMGTIRIPDDTPDTLQVPHEPQFGPEERVLRVTFNVSGNRDCPSKTIVKESILRTE